MDSVTYIHENYNKKFPLDKLYEIAHLSKSSYFRLFKQIFKMAPLEYINKQKIEEAKNMLINTQYSISDVAYRTGFYDISHFTKRFESEVGVTPTAYRKKEKNDFYIL